MLLLIGRRHQHRHVVPEYFAFGIPKQVPRGLVKGFNPSTVVHGNNAIRGRIHNTLRENHGIDELTFSGFHGLFQPLLIGNVRGEFDHLVDLTVGIQDGIVGGLKPHLFPPFPQPQVNTGIELAPIELGPEDLVLRAGDIGGIAEHPMVLALNLREIIAQEREEVLVGREHGTIQRELNCGLGFVNRRHLALKLRRLYGGDLQQSVDVTSPKPDHVSKPDRYSQKGHQQNTHQEQTYLQTCLSLPFYLNRLHPQPLDCLGDGLASFL